MIKIRNLKEQEGRSLIELLLVLGLIIMVIAFMFRKVQERVTNQEDVAIAMNIRAINDGVQTYMQSKYRELTEDKQERSFQAILSGPGFDPDDPVYKELKTYIPQDMEAIKHSGDYAVGFKITKESLARISGSASEDRDRMRISALVVNTKSTKPMTDGRVAKIATMVGTQGGYTQSEIFASSQAQTEIVVKGSAKGAWTLKPTEFFGGEDIVGRKNIVATSSYIEATAGDSEGMYLYRSNLSQFPDANMMRTDLDMDWNRINNISGMDVTETVEIFAGQSDTQALMKVDKTGNFDAWRDKGQGTDVGSYLDLGEKGNKLTVDQQAKIEDEMYVENEKNTAIIGGKQLTTKSARAKDMNVYGNADMTGADLYEKGAIGVITVNKDNPNSNSEVKTSINSLDINYDKDAGEKFLIGGIEFMERIGRNRGICHIYEVGTVENVNLETYALTDEQVHQWMGHMCSASGYGNAGTTFYKADAKGGTVRNEQSLPDRSGCMIYQDNDLAAVFKDNFFNDAAPSMVSILESTPGYVIGYNKQGGKYQNAKFVSCICGSGNGYACRHSKASNVMLKYCKLNDASCTPKTVVERSMAAKYSCFAPLKFYTKSYASAIKDYSGGNDDYAQFVNADTYNMKDGGDLWTKKIFEGAKVKNPSGVLSEWYATYTMDISRAVPVYGGRPGGYQVGTGPATAVKRDSAGTVLTKTSGTRMETKTPDPASDVFRLMQRRVINPTSVVYAGEARENYNTEPPYETEHDKMLRIGGLQSLMLSWTEGNASCVFQDDPVSSAVNAGHSPAYLHTTIQPPATGNYAAAVPISSVPTIPPEDTDPDPQQQCNCPNITTLYQDRCVSTCQSDEEQFKGKGKTDCECKKKCTSKQKRNQNSGDCEEPELTCTDEETKVDGVCCKNTVSPPVAAMVSRVPSRNIGGMDVSERYEKLFEGFSAGECSYELYATGNLGNSLIVVETPSGSTKDDIESAATSCVNANTAGPVECYVTNYFNKNKSGILACVGPSKTSTKSLDCVTKGDAKEISEKLIYTIPKGKAISLFVGGGDASNNIDLIWQRSPGDTNNSGSFELRLKK